MNLRLEVSAFEDEAHWRWRLLDAQGAFLADHEVALDRGDAEHDGFADPYRFVRWHAGPDGAAQTEAQLVDQLGRWIGTHAWGAVGAAIVEQAKSASVVVRVHVPTEAEVLLFRPLELGFVGGRPLAHWDVSLVFELGDPAGGGNAQKARVGAHLRLLALFSMPTDQPALNVRHERRELRQLVHRVALTAGGAVELRILQYGVTRERLRDVLAEGGGWDAIHFSGHGLPAGLVLERSDGSSDVIATDDLVELLWPSREQLKLVTLSSCESAAATAAQTMQLLGLPPDAAGASRAAGGEGRALPAVAHGLAEQLGCAVVAMRYPVEDEFAIALAGQLYGGLLRDRQPLARALQVAIQRTTGPASASATSPLSVATPALFGAAAIDLALELPPGRPAGFDVSTPGLAYFDPEPPRFVGRVGALARASDAFDVDSARRAVLFHGMAGGGKTACALELAYRHHERRFEAMVWHRAPSEGHDIASALADFAISLETQLDGIEMTPYVMEREQLRRFLPRLTRLLADRSILIAIDNVESLLAPDGSWRDPSWELLVRALVAHDGLSRLVVTSRYVPASLGADARILVEQVNGLSAAESVLLARQLPNLGALIQGTAEIEPQEGRRLVRDVLETVQGSPKLIELADRQADDPDALRDRLREAHAAWHDGGGRLGTFFATGQPDRDYGVEDFMRVLETWTLGAAGRLPEHAHAAFSLLCAIESTDRTEGVVKAVWEGLWLDLELPGDPPDVQAALESVAAHGLIEIAAETEGAPAVYRIHPAVEEAGRRAAGPELQATVDRRLASFWEQVFELGLSHEGRERTGQAIIHAGLSAAPYLLRLGAPDQAASMLENVVNRDESSHTLAIAIPYLLRIEEQTDERTTALGVRALILEARARHRPREGAAALRELLEQAEQEDEHAVANGVAGMLVNLLRLTGQPEEALAVVERKVRLSERAGVSAWVPAADEAMRLQLLQAMGRNASVLREARTLLAHLDKLEESGEEPDVVVPWNVREGVYTAAMGAATHLRRFDEALEFNAAVQESQRRRGAARLERAECDLNAYGPLLRLGRHDEAEKLIRRCRDVFEQEQSLHGLMVVYSAWADLEDERGRYDEAVHFERRALRLAYALASRHDIVICHNNLGGCMERAGQNPGKILVHRLAAAMISFGAGFGLLRSHLHWLGVHLRQHPRESIPSYETLIELLRAEEFDFEGVLAGLPRMQRNGVDPVVVVVALAHWSLVVETLGRAVDGDAEAEQVLDEALASLAAQGAEAVVHRFRRIRAGERDVEALVAGLRPIDAAVVELAVARLAQR